MLSRGREAGAKSTASLRAGWQRRLAGPPEGGPVGPSAHRTVRPSSTQEAHGCQLTTMAANAA